MSHSHHIVDLSDSDKSINCHHHVVSLILFDIDYMVYYPGPPNNPQLAYSINTYEQK